MHVLAGHHRKHNRIELGQHRDVRFDELEGAGSAHLLAADVVMRLRAVKRKIDAELFALQVFNDGVVKQGGVRIDRKTQAELGRRRIRSRRPEQDIFAKSFMRQFFREFHSPMDGVHAKQRFATEESDVQKALVQRKRALEGQPDGRLHNFIRHYETARLVAHLVIAIGATKVTPFR